MADSKAPDRPGAGPTAYLLTFACYGARLHGDSRGSVDSFHNAWGTPMVEPGVDRERFARRLSERPGVKLGAEERLLVLESIRRHAEIRGWLLHAVHVRSNHVHVVVEADVPPEKAMEQFKAYASRSLNRRSTGRGKRWAHHGSTRHLWQPRQISAAVDYVVNRQGRPMAVYRNPEPWKAIEPTKDDTH